MDSQKLCFVSNLQNTLAAKMELTKNMQEIAIQKEEIQHNCAVLKPRLNEKAVSTSSENEHKTNVVTKKETAKTPSPTVKRSIIMSTISTSPASPNRPRPQYMADTISSAIKKTIPSPSAQRRSCVSLRIPSKWSPNNTLKTVGRCVSSSTGDWSPQTYAVSEQDEMEADKENSVNNDMPDVVNNESVNGVSVSHRKKTLRFSPHPPAIIPNMIFEAERLEKKGILLEDNHNKYGYVDGNDSHVLAEKKVDIGHKKQIHLNVPCPESLNKMDVQLLFKNGLQENTCIVLSLTSN